MNKDSRESDCGEWSAEDFFQSFLEGLEHPLKEQFKIVLDYLREKVPFLPAPFVDPVNDGPIHLVWSQDLVYAEIVIARNEEIYWHCRNRDPEREALSLSGFWEIGFRGTVTSEGPVPDAIFIDSLRQVKDWDALASSRSDNDGT